MFERFADHNAVEFGSLECHESAHMNPIGSSQNLDAIALYAGGPPRFDAQNIVITNLLNQSQILKSLASRIDSVLADVKGKLFAELQDEELGAAQQLIKVSPRAAGALAGVVLERHLQRVAINHAITIRKKKPTISDLNDPLKKADVYDTPTWRKIQFLADVRNLCSHNKNRDPTIAEVEELISGVNAIIKTIF